MTDVHTVLAIARSTIMTLMNMPIPLINSTKHKGTERPKLTKKHSPGAVVTDVSFSSLIGQKVKVTVLRRSLR